MDDCSTRGSDSKLSKVLVSGVWRTGLIIPSPAESLVMDTHLERFVTGELVSQFPHDEVLEMEDARLRVDDDDAFR